MKDPGPEGIPREAVGLMRWVCEAFPSRASSNAAVLVEQHAKGRLPTGPTFLKE